MAEIIPHPNSDGPPVMEAAIAAWKATCESYEREAIDLRERCALAADMVDIMFCGQSDAAIKEDLRRVWRVLKGKS